MGGDCNNSACRCLLFLEFRDKIVGKWLGSKTGCFSPGVTSRLEFVTIGLPLQLDRCEVLSEINLHGFETGPVNV